ncbi:MAG: M28 family peptidase [Candidatus Aminicenantes bacterium]|nr:M28 family peptidase [Candidatus Aminicenantes bacterium]
MKKCRWPWVSCVVFFHLLCPAMRADAGSKTLSAVRVLNPPGVRGSDFAPFFLQGIPCAAFWSNGPHIEYHTPGDTIYRINPDILADIARLAFRAACQVADL